MNPSQYSKIENGKVDPQISSIERIIKALDVEIAEFLVQIKSLMQIH